jgi:peptide/nickel transport system permease protein
MIRSRKARFMRSASGTVASAVVRRVRPQTATIGVLVLITVVCLAIIGPILSPYDPIAMAPSQRILPPGSPGHVFGTDQFGRDMLTRILAGGRISLLIGAVPVTLSVLIGLLIGLVSGYYGGWVDQVVSRLMDILFAFPAVLLAIAIVAILGPGVFNAILAITVTAIPTTARIVRAPTLSLREQEFVLAARVIGANDGRILLRHVAPNVLTPLMVFASLELGHTIIFASGLSFLGLGAQPPEAEWGLMLAEGRSLLPIAPHVATLPGLAIVIVVLALNFVGDAVRDLIDPRTRRSISTSEASELQRRAEK